MTSPSLTTNNAVPFQRQTRFQPTFASPALLSTSRLEKKDAVHLRRCGEKKKLNGSSEKARATVSPAAEVAEDSFLIGFMENLRKENRNYKNRGRKK